VALIGLARKCTPGLEWLGAERVVLTTDTNGNDAVNKFYQRLGFSCVRTFEARRGRLLNEYVIEIGKDRACESLS
jgi:ribosomal protein S18 acetylase RimI-like enzyme